MGEFTNYSGMIALAIFFVLFVLFIKYESNHMEEDIEEENEIEQQPINQANPLDLNDEDATVACLVAAIECQNETHKNVHIVSVREVK